MSLRSWLRLLNFKANHRKLIVADSSSAEINALITSANPHDASSSHSNVAFYFQGNPAIALLESELAIAAFSGWKPEQPFPKLVVKENFSEVNKNVEAACITEIEIRNRLVNWFDQAGEGDQIDVAVFYLAERKLIRSLLNAAGRGVKIRLILDANKDAFGREKNGIPNRSVANELVRKGDGNIKVRWYETHGEQFHSKLSMVSLRKSQVPMLYTTLGSANYTRRNISNYNLEANLAVKIPLNSELANKMKRYFDTVWHNRGGNYTVDYSSYTDDSKLRYWQYRLMEATGMSSF